MKLRWLWSSILLFSLSVVASTTSAWVFEDVGISRLSAEHERYLYVPKGQTFRDVVLSGQVEVSEGLNSLEVLLDGELVESNIFTDSRAVEIALPDLTPGFHRLDFRGRPAARVDPLQEQMSCPVIVWAPFVLEQVRIDYRVERVHAPFLSDLPDPLFNAARPGEILGQLILDTADQAEISAASRVMYWLGTFSDITWDGKDSLSAPDLPQRFSLRFDHDSELAVPARLQLSNMANENGFGQLRPELRIAYRTEEGLSSALHALVGEFRTGLRNDSWELDQPVEMPLWAQPKRFETLADFGVSDLVLRGYEQRQVFLQMPPHWEVTGTLSGELAIRGQEALRDGARLDIWRDMVLLGSVTEGQQPGTAPAEVNLRDARLWRSQAGTLNFDARLAPAPNCHFEEHGLLWVDSAESRLSLPHHVRTGIASYIPRLLLRPVVSSTLQGAALATTLNEVLAPVRFISDGAPLPIIIVSPTNAGSETASLHLDVLPERHRELMTQFQAKLPIVLGEDIVFLHAPAEEGVHVIAGDDAALPALARVWGDIWPDIGDRINLAAVDTVSGNLLVLDRSVLPGPARLPLPGTSVGEYQALLVAGVMLFSFVVLIISLLRWKRRW